MPNIGPLELIIVLVIVLIVVGPKKLPGLGKSLGTGMREFKDSVSGSDKSDDELLEQRQQPVAPTTPAPPAPVAQPAAPAQPEAAAPVQQPAPVDPAAPQRPEGQ